MRKSPSRPGMRWVILCALALWLPSVAVAKKVPNIVLIVADDLGWADLGCYGNKFNETPNLDRLARQGLRFTDFYAAAPVCSPTRASIISGQYPARLGLTAHIPGHWRPFEKLVEPPNALELPETAPSVAQTLKRAGYTTGYFGKWHLGGKTSGPGRYGFDTVFEFVGHSVPAARQIGGGNAPKRGCEYLADLAISFIETNRAKPFFIHINPYAVHIPLTTTPELQRKYEGKPKVDGYPCHPLYAGLLEELDTAVGRVLQSLQQFQLADNTLVIFTSDNGGLEREMGGWPGTSNRPLRNEKGSIYEGGLRVPFIASWPGVVKSGTTSVPGISIDLFPTFADVAGLQPPRDVDGISLLPVFKNGSAKLKRDTLFWHYPHYHHSRPSGAVRVGDWKLIEFFDSEETELYNLADDISESRNLAAAMPKKTDELRASLESWRKSLAAQMPQRNPAYDPARAGEWWSRAKIAPTEAPGTFK